MEKAPCSICDGTGNLDDVDGDPHGRTCRNCGGSGVRRPTHVDPKPTIAPGTLQRTQCGRCGGDLRIAYSGGLVCDRCFQEGRERAGAKGKTWEEFGADWRAKMGDMASWPCYCPAEETLDQFWLRLRAWMADHPEACCGWVLVGGNSKDEVSVMSVADILDEPRR